MPDDIKIPVTTPGARQAKQALRGVADAEKQIGQAGKQGGREAAEGLDRAERGAGRLMSKIKSLVASFAGMALVRRILSGLAEETERMDRASLRAAESMRSILALSTLGKERPEVQRALYEMAVSAESDVRWPRSGGRPCFSRRS